MNAETAQSTFPNLATLVVTGIVLSIIGVSAGLLIFRRRRKTSNQA